MPSFPNERPRAGPRFYKAHGLGNDYLVVEEGAAWTADARSVARVCDRLRGVGGDGIVVVLDPAEEPFRLRMFNPDGGEFERSGNGLRVLASWLHRAGRVETGRPFEVEVGGDRIAMTVHDRSDRGVYDVSVEMGRAGVGPEAVAADPAVLGAPDGGAHGALELEGEGRIPVHLVSVGNPHCVVFTEALSAPGLPEILPTRDLLGRLGPLLTTHPAFAHGTNVQIARVAEGATGVSGDAAAAALPDTSAPTGVGGRGGGARGGVVDALVWERGVGHTTASGTSACAVAVAAVESGRLGPGRVEVRMEGGSLFVEVGSDLDVVLRGPVEEVMTGEMGPGLVGGSGG